MKRSARTRPYRVLAALRIQRSRHEAVARGEPRRLPRAVVAQKALVVARVRLEFRGPAAGAAPPAREDLELAQGPVDRAGDRCGVGHVERALEVEGLER